MCGVKDANPRRMTAFLRLRGGPISAATAATLLYLCRVSCVQLVFFFFLSGHCVVLQKERKKEPSLNKELDEQKAARLTVN